MKRIYTTALFGLLLFIITGCDKSFLDVLPTEFLTEGQVAEAGKNNPEVGLGGVRGIYTLMFQTGTGGTDLDHDDFGQKGYDIYLDFLSSDMALKINTYNWYNDLTQYTATTDYTNNTNYKPWRYYYRLIRAANLVIQSLGGNDITPESDADKYSMGQAKAMRAHSYFYLSQLFATSYNPTEKVLPIYTDPDQQNQPQSTTQEVFDLIIKDLTEAVELLNGFTRSEKYEINKYVAEAILAYAYATIGGNENYTKAKNLTSDIIENGGFTLLPASEVAFAGDKTKGGFNSVKSPSWMWGIDITLDNGLDLVSWWGQMDQFTYSYQWAGDRKVIDDVLFSLIPADDIRKKQFYTNSTTSSYYLAPTNKFYDPNRVTGGQRNIETDYLYMRIEEIYLLHAETAAKSGDEPAARISLKDLLSLRVPNVTYIDALSGQNLLDEIYFQTRIELWGEGKSYLAMKRNKATIRRGTNHLSYVNVAIPYNDPRLTFSIPQSEVLDNPFFND